MQTEIELEFADGQYLFALRLPQIIELQRVCGAGIFTIYGRLMEGRYLLGGEAVGSPNEGAAFILDVYESIRLGLIGGGRGMVNGDEVAVSPLRAKQLMETYVYPAPLVEAWNIAAAVQAAKIVGYEPKKKAPQTKRGKAQTESTPPK